MVSELEMIVIIILFCVLDAKEIFFQKEICKQLPDTKDSNNVFVSVSDPGMCVCV